MEDFVSFDLAKKLKEKGFRKKCYAYYRPHDTTLSHNHNPYRGGIFEDCVYSFNSLGEGVINSDFIDAPTISQVLKWLREEKNVEVIPSFDYEERIWGYQVGDMNLRVDVILAYLWDFKTYESAALTGSLSS